MKKIILLACLFVCMILVFASCADKVTEMSAQEYFDSYGDRETAAPVLQNASSLGELSRLNFQDTLGGKILVFATDSEKSPKIKFYNAETGSFIFDAPYEDVPSYTTVTVYDQTYLLVVQKDAEEENAIATLSLIDANGNFIASQTYTPSYNYDEYGNPIGYGGLTSYVKYSDCDLFAFSGNVYRVQDNGGATLVASNPFFAALDNDVIKTNEYYYEVSSREVTVYTHDLKEAFHWRVPYGTVDQAFISVLANEKILVQMVDILPDETTSKFDFWYYDGNKANLETLLIDFTAEKEKDVEKELDLDYIVAGVKYNTSMVFSAEDKAKNTYSELIENLAEIYYIEDKKLNTAESVTVSLSSEDASVVTLIAPEFDSVPEEVAPGYFLYTTDSGNKYLLNSQFEVIGNANNFYAATRTDAYIVLGNKIYDYKLKLVMDLDANEEEFVNLVGKSAIVRCEEDDEYVYYLRTKDGARVEIDDFAYATEKFYATAELNKKDGTYDYTFYNQDGTAILSIDDVEGGCRVIYTSEKGDSCIVTAIVNEKNVYYKLTK